MVLGHVRPHDHDAVGVLEVLLEVGGAAAPERGPQTGDRRAVSYAGLVLDRHRAGGREELLDQVVLLVVERGAAQVRNAQGAVEHGLLALDLLRRLPGALAGGDEAVGDHVHRPFQVDLFPAVRPRRPVLRLRLPPRVGDELLRRRPLGAQAPAGDRRVGVTLDLDDLLVAHVDLLPAADGAVGADRLDHAVRLLRARPELFRAPGARGPTEAQPVFAQLSKKGERACAPCQTNAHLPDRVRTPSIGWHRGEGRDRQLGYKVAPGSVGTRGEEAEWT